MTVVAPGSAQVAMGNKGVGRLALTIWAAVLGGAGYIAYKARTDRATVLGWGFDSDLMLWGRIALVAAAVLWIGLFIDAWRLGSPFRLTLFRGAVIMLLNTAIVLGVAGSTAFAANLMRVQESFVKDVFTETQVSEPLEGRYNILLVGSDARADRIGIRPDSLTVASIDTQTGATVLVSLPRNLQRVPFREDSPLHDVYPYGYNCGSTCLLNAVHTMAQNRTDLYPDSDDPGLDATIDAVEGATDLTINYYVMINLNGFKDMIDALGGVTVDVKTRIAMFGKADAYKNAYIEPGKQKLNGQKSLWYARSRVQSDDYVRMGRQKCLMAAMASQLSPQLVVQKAGALANAGKGLLETDMPAGELGKFADLALKSRGTKISTVSLVPPAVSTTNPDFDTIHEMIADAIDASEKGATPSTPTPTDPAKTDEPTAPTPTRAPTTQQIASQSAANQADDLTEVC